MIHLIGAGDSPYSAYRGIKTLANKEPNQSPAKDNQFVNIVLLNYSHNGVL